MSRVSPYAYQNSYNSSPWDGIPKIPHRNRSQVQVSLKVTAQIDHLNITVTLDFFLMFDIFSIDQSPEIAGKLNNHVLDYK